ncbi:MAG: LacI family transcriptional regulator [Treponema sp.]|jgi:LacI family transcriptional regulator|nr:LacI family transcriptional regulator [Treponema sp.]
MDMAEKSKRFASSMATAKRPTMKDVAQQAGVSITSVSHMLNGTRFVSEDVTSRIDQAIRTLNFRPNPIARNLRSGKSKLIGFMVSNMENYFYVNIAKGIEKTLSAYGYRLVLIDSAENKKNEIDNVESLYLRGVDGLIIAPTDPNCEYLRNILRPGFPVVFVDRQPVNYNGDTILLANSDAAYTATNYFISKGCRSIGFLTLYYGGTTIDKTMQERIDGYKKALHDANIPEDDNCIKAVPGISAAANELQYTESYKMMEQLLQIPVRAVLCGNSLAAIGAYSLLRDKKIRIPEEVSLITFDDDIWLKLTTPRISSVVQPMESFGVLAARRLMTRLEGKDLPYECFRLKAEMVLRES